MCVCVWGEGEWKLEQAADGKWETGPVLRVAYLVDVRGLRAVRHGEGVAVIGAHVAQAADLQRQRHAEGGGLGLAQGLEVARAAAHEDGAEVVATGHELHQGALQVL